MANVITGNPWKLDTVGFSFTGDVKINSIEWNGPTATHDILITDGRDRPIISGKAAVTNVNEQYMVSGWYRGIKLATLGSGTVHIHLG